MKFVLRLLFSVVWSCAVKAVELPGEGGDKAVLDAEWFPSRMHCFVFRNWTCVPKARLAEVVGAAPRQVEALAAAMGLPPQGEVSPDWQTRGYITVLRRNWHLLPYGQLLTLLGQSREQLHFNLLEDDFLFVKLGNMKPACETLVWDDAYLNAQDYPMPNVEYPSPPESREPRFAFIPNLQVMGEIPPPAAPDRASPFDLRFIFSYFAEYGDPLATPDVPSYPEGLLQRLAAQGVNGVWVHTVLRTLARDPAFPEFGEGCEKRIAGLRALVERARKYGIQVYLYMNEPRAMPAAFFDARPERTAMRGVKTRDGNVRMCTSTPEVRRWMCDALADVFTRVPGLGGVFTITASENETSCAAHNVHPQCEHCENRDYAEMIAEVNRTIRDGVKRAAPDAKVIVWDWGWHGHGDAVDVIGKLPADCWFMSVSEWQLPIERGGVASAVGEYSISAVGPGPRATKHWAAAKARGMKCVAKVQAGTTWELGSFPYLPVMGLVAEHAKSLSAAGVDGLMLSWSLGGYPSPNLDVFHRAAKGAGVDDVLDALARDRYGPKPVNAVHIAWQFFADGFREYPYHIGTLYHGPQHVGPANPFYLRPTGYTATMVGFPYDDLAAWRAVYPEEVWIRQMREVAAGCENGCAMFGIAIEKMDDGVKAEARRELDMYRAQALHFASCANQAAFVAARDRGDKEAMRRIVTDEIAVVRKLLPLVEADSRIGYESSNHYFYIPQDLLEKLVNCQYVLSRL